jgi:trehalose-phosphatase
MRDLTPSETGQTAETPEALEHWPQPWSAFARSGWWRALARSTASVLMLDYDGTLAPFQRERMEATTYPGVPERLVRLAGTPGIRLVLVSGRPTIEISKLLPPDLNVEIWGSHGREKLLPGGHYEIASLTPEQNRCLDELQDLVGRNGFPAQAERKIGSLALHTRGLDPGEATRIHELAESYYRSIVCVGHTDLEWMNFDGGIELRGTGCTKGNAVRAILAEVSEETPVAYLGDDQTDEDAFRALSHRSNAACVLVRQEPRASIAEWWIQPPDELLALLDMYLEVRRSGAQK